MKICNTPGCRKLYDHGGACEIRRAAARPYTPKKMDVEHTYIAQRMRSDPELFSEVTKEFRRFIVEVERAAAERAWIECDATITEHLVGRTAITAAIANDWPENPYRREETE